VKIQRAFCAYGNTHEYTKEFEQPQTFHIIRFTRIDHQPVTIVTDVGSAVRSGYQKVDLFTIFKILQTN